MHLIDCFIPPLAFLRQFQIRPAGNLESVRQQLDVLLADACRDALAAGMGEINTQDGLFAVAALGDEILLSSSWSGAGEWARHLLQKRHFNVTNAGNAFFTRLEAMGPQQMPAREVYFYCLSLGFAGRYGYDRNAKALADIKQTSLSLILRALRSDRDGAGLSPEMEKLMFPDGYGYLHGAGEEANKKSASRWGWKLSSLTVNVLLIPLIVLVVLYGVYHTIIWQMVKTLLVQVN